MHAYSVFGGTEMFPKLCAHSVYLCNYPTNPRLVTANVTDGRPSGTSASRLLSICASSSGSFSARPSMLRGITSPYARNITHAGSTSRPAIKCVPTAPRSARRFPTQRPLLSKDVADDRDGSPTGTVRGGQPHGSATCAAPDHLSPVPPDTRGKVKPAAGTVSHRCAFDGLLQRH